MKQWRVQPPFPAEGIAETHETDVLVVGLSHSGSAAMRAAAEAGARTIGIEERTERKYRVVGMDYGHLNSRFLESRGVPKVDPIEYFNELMRRALGRANPGLLMRFCQNAGTAFDWYTDTVEDFSSVRTPFWPGSPKFDGEMAGFHFWPGTAQFGQPGGRWGPGLAELGDEMTLDSLVEEVKTKPSLMGLARANQKKAIDLGGKTFFGMAAENILREEGRVTGILARDRDGALHLFRAGKAVILAAGGFNGDVDMLEELLPDYRDIFCGDETFQKGMMGTGMGVRLGVWAGGRLESGPIATMDGFYNTPRGVNAIHGLLWLDPYGKRFTNECFGDPVIAGMPGNQMKRGDYMNIFDSGILRDLEWAVPAHEGFDYGDESHLAILKNGMEQALQAGKGGAVVRTLHHRERIVAGRNMEELLDNAGLTGVLRENVKNSILRYNELCRKGRDEDFGKDAKLLRPLEDWPLFLQFNPFTDVGRMMCTCGGLLTDETQNVLDHEYDPIPGLYATGNCCGRRFGPQYSTPTAGLSIGMAVTLGREAGKEAAKA